MIVTAHIKFSLYTTFLDQMVQAEDERLPNESVEDGVIRVHKALEQAVQKIKDAHKIDLGFGPGIEPAGSMEILSQTDPHKLGVAYFDKNGGITQVIDYKQKENLEIAIDNATSLEDLAKLKEQAGKQGLIHPYMEKMNELISKQKEFTDGIE